MAGTSLFVLEDRSAMFAMFHGTPIRRKSIAVEIRDLIACIAPFNPTGVDNQWVPDVEPSGIV